MKKNNRKYLIKYSFVFPLIAFVIGVCAKSMEMDEKLKIQAEETRRIESLLEDDSNIYDVSDLKIDDTTYSKIHKLWGVLFFLSIALFLIFRVIRLNVLYILALVPNMGLFVLSGL